MQRSGFKLSHGSRRITYILKSCGSGNFRAKQTLSWHVLIINAIRVSFWIRGVSRACITSSVNMITLLISNDIHRSDCRLLSGIDVFWNALVNNICSHRFAGLAKVGTWSSVFRLFEVQLPCSMDSLRYVKRWALIRAWKGWISRFGGRSVAIFLSRQAVEKTQFAKQQRYLEWKRVLGIFCEGKQPILFIPTTALKQ